MHRNGFKVIIGAYADMDLLLDVVVLNNPVSVATHVCNGGFKVSWTCQSLDPIY